MALLLDSLSLDDDLQANIRKEGLMAGFTQADKIVIHIRYLLTSRFEEAHDLSLRLMSAFIQITGPVLAEGPELLKAVADLKM